MPIYDYVCHHCGHRFEVIHGLHADGPKECPVCHSHEVRKAFAPPTIVFKGSGWAKKDRRATSKPAETKSGDSKGEDGDARPTGSGADAAATPADGATASSAGTATASKDSDGSSSGAAGKASSAGESTGSAKTSKRS